MQRDLDVDAMGYLKAVLNHHIKSMIEQQRWISHHVKTHLFPLPPRRLIYRFSFSRFNWNFLPVLTHTVLLFLLPLRPLQARLCKYLTDIAYRYQLNQGNTASVTSSNQTITCLVCGPQYATFFKNLLFILFCISPKMDIENGDSCRPSLRAPTSLDSARVSDLFARWE